jgi:predicted membrane channel-forming protein YqfA (hemolysin III family)
MVVKKVACWILLLFGLFSAIPIKSEPGPLWSDWLGALISVMMLWLILDMAALIFSRWQRFFAYLVSEVILYLSLAIYFVVKAFNAFFETGTAKTPLVIISVLIVGALIVVLRDVVAQWNLVHSSKGKLKDLSPRLR